MTTLLLLMLLFVVSILAQAYFAGYETGFISINDIRLRYLAEEKGVKRAAQLLRGHAFAF